MKKTILLLLLSFVLNNCYSQFNIFGIDVSKHLSYGENINFKEIVCASNPYFTKAEYKIGNFDFERGFLLFFNYKVNVKAPLKNQEKYYKELKKNISVTFGKDIQLFLKKSASDSLTFPVSSKFLWVKKYKEKYLVGVLQFNGDIQCEVCGNEFYSFIIYIYDSKEVLLKGVKHMFSAHENTRAMYYHEKTLENLK